MDTAHRSRSNRSAEQTVRDVEGRRGRIRSLSWSELAALSLALDLSPVEFLLPSSGEVVQVGELRLDRERLASRLDLTKRFDDMRRVVIRLMGKQEEVSDQ